jgi:hypothetical protein
MKAQRGEWKEKHIEFVKVIWRTQVHGNLCSLVEHRPPGANVQRQKLCSPHWKSVGKSMFAPCSACLQAMASDSSAIHASSSSATLFSIVRSCGSLALVGAPI